MRRGFLILHGLANFRPREHWQSWLSSQLAHRGEAVRYPQLPDPEHPDLGRWLSVFSEEYRALGEGERVVICHSLSCFLFFQAVANGALAEAAGRVLLVAPPGPSVISWPVTPGFGDHLPDKGALGRAARQPIRLVSSDADEYSPEGPATLIYGRRLGLDCETIVGAGHLAIADGYGAWPGVLAWCLDGTVRIASVPKEDAPSGFAC